MFHHKLLGGNSGDLLAFRTRLGLKSFSQIASMDWPDEIELVQEHWGLEGFNEPALRDDQISVSQGKMKKLHDWSQKKDPLNRADHPVWDRFWMAHWGAAIEAVAKSWGEDLRAVLESSSIRPDKHTNEDGSITYVLSSDKLVRPSSCT